MNDKKVTLFGSAILGATILLMGCNHEALKTCQANLKICDNDLKDCRNRCDGTAPTCAACDLTYGPTPMNVVGQLVGMTRNYSFVAVETDVGLSTEKRFKLANMPTMSHPQFGETIGPAPATKPQGAQLWLFVPTGATFTPVHANGVFTIH